MAIERVLCFALCLQSRSLKQDIREGDRKGSEKEDMLTVAR